MSDTPPPIDTSPVANALADMTPSPETLTLRQGKVTGIASAHGAAGSLSAVVAVDIGASGTAVDLRYLGAAPRVDDSVWILDNGVDKLVLGPLATAVPPGTITMFGSSTPPPGWLLCNGQSTSGYAALAAVVGGAVPDLRNRFIVGAGSNYSSGATGGADTVALGDADMPNHLHGIAAHSHSTQAHGHVSNPNRGSVTDGAGTSANITTGGGGYVTIAGTTSAEGVTINTGGPTVTATNGGGGYHENRPPYYALTFIIKA